MKKASDYYDEFSARYERGRSRGYHRMIDDMEAAVVIPHAAGKDVLEAGCGTGLLMERLRGAGAAIVGADISRGMLERARGRGLTVVQSDLRRLPFRDSSFDIVYSFKVLAHVEDLPAALREMVRVTRIGGRIYPEFYNRRSLRFLVRTLKGARKIAAGTTDREVYTRYHRWKEIMSMIPGSCRLEAVYGVRIWTPLPFLIRVPLLGRLLEALERACARSPLARFAGFVILVLEKIE